MSLELAYIGIDVAEPDAFGRFLTDVVGLLPGDPVAGAATFRNDSRVHRIIVGEGSANDATFVGFETANHDEFDAAVARIQASGTPYAEGSTADLAARRVDALVRVDAPWGVPVEIVLGLADSGHGFDSSLVPGGFLTEGQGFGHVVFVTTDLASADTFACDVLGLRQSDWLESDLGGMPLTVRFYHCNRRHHSLAIGELPVELPQKLHHVMVEATSVDDVGRAFDRAWTAGLPIANALGRHDNDRMFSFYVVTPAGFQLEFGQGARGIEEPWTDDRRYDRISAWGHQPLASPFHQ